MHQLMAATLDAIVDGDPARSRTTRAANGGTRAPALADDRAAHARRAGPVPKEIDGKRTEDYWRSHQVPMGEMHENPAHVRILEQWMKSYRPEELFDDSGRLKPELAALAPAGRRAA